MADRISKCRSFERKIRCLREAGGNGAKMNPARGKEKTQDCRKAEVQEK